MDRISELTRIARERELTPDEQAERKALREEYIADWRRSTIDVLENTYICLLYTSPSPRDLSTSRMPSSA